MEQENFNEQPKYAQRFKIKDNCLLEIKTSKQSVSERMLCNFTPWLTAEVTMDDGMETTTHIKLRGIHQNGRQLPEVQIPAAELANFNWLAKHWGMDCILEVGQTVKDSVRYAIQTTAEQADRKMVYAVTGWRKLNGRWEYLMPGNEAQTVQLPGKMHGYFMEPECDCLDIQVAACLLTAPPALEEIILPLLAFMFLSPLNHFLKQAGCEPKFVLFLVGKTGSRKSTLAALMLSFFGRFTASELPLSFRDTANSILHNAFALKDVLTCIDDFHPAGRQEEAKLTATAQSVMRAFGDRIGKGRLRADSSPMDARPPQDNAILTAEFPPDIGESGTARYFALERKESDVDLHSLSSFQNEAAKETLQKCMYGYIRWIQESFLFDDEQQKRFVDYLQRKFVFYRDAFQQSGILCHGRVPETVAWLRIGLDMLLEFLKSNHAIPEDYMTHIQSRFQSILYRLAAKQADNIILDKPTHKFIRKLYALIESGQATLLPKTHAHDFIRGNCIGYEDDDYIYLHSDVAHKAVKKLCEEQGESFTVSARGLMKALAEENLISPGPTQNTKPLRVGEKNIRLLWLKKRASREIADMG